MRTFGVGAEWSEFELANFEHVWVRSRVSKGRHAKHEFLIINTWTEKVRLEIDSTIDGSTDANYDDGGKIWKQEPLVLGKIRQSGSTREPSKPLVGADVKTLQMIDVRIKSTLVDGGGAAGDQTFHLICA